jgi:hypothetical protein
VDKEEEVGAMVATRGQIQYRVRLWQLPVDKFMYRVRLWHLPVARFSIGCAYGSYPWPDLIGCAYGSYPWPDLVGCAYMAATCGQIRWEVHA